MDNQWELTVAQGTLLKAMVTYMGRKSKKQGMDAYVSLIHFAAQEKRTLWSNYTPIRIEKKDILFYYLLSFSHFQGVKQRENSEFCVGVEKVNDPNDWIQSLLQVR